MPGRCGIALAGLLVVLPACSGDRADAGPLGGPGGAAYLCTPLPGQSPVVFGNEVLRNGASRSVTVNSVRLVGADSLTLDEAFLVPIRDRTLLGSDLLPPKADVWQDRRPADGRLRMSEPRQPAAPITSGRSGTSSSCARPHLVPLGTRPR